jgi:hypothetical protein
MYNRLVLIVLSPMEKEFIVGLIFIIQREMKQLAANKKMDKDFMHTSLPTKGLVN